MWIIRYSHLFKGYATTWGEVTLSILEKKIGRGEVSWGVHLKKGEDLL